MRYFEQDLVCFRTESGQLRIRHWPVAELDGLVLLWFGVEGEAPTWPAPRMLPETANLEVDYWPVFPSTCKVWRGVRFPPQVSTENSGDAAHFHYVHGMASVPKVEEWSSGEHWFTTSFCATFGGHAPTTWATPKGQVEGRIVTTCHGMGLAAGHIQSFDRVFTLSATTPIDRHTVEARKMAARWW